MATMLIVEDEVIIRVLAESVLQRAGYETLSASSLLEVQGIVDSDAKFDLLFADLTLHKDHDAGIEVAKLVTERRPGTPVLQTQGGVVRVVAASASTLSPLASRQGIWADFELRFR